MREGKVAADLGPDDARALLEAWLAGVGLDARGRELIAYLQADGFSHADLYRRARRSHERRLRARGRRAASSPSGGRPRRRRQRPLRGAAPGRPLRALDRLPRRREGEAARPATATGAGGRPDRRRDRLDARRHPHDRADPRARRPRLRGRGDRHRPRRRPPPAGRRRAGAALLRGDAARGPGPARPGRDPGRGQLRPRPRHRSRPGRDRGDAARPDHRRAAARQLPHRARHLRRPAQRRRRMLEALARVGLGAFYGAPRVVLSPSPAADASLAELGIDPAPRSVRWERGVDVERFDPAKADRDAYPGEIKVLYAGRLTREKGVDLLAESLPPRPRGRPAPAPAAGGRRPRGGRAARAARRAATFLGWLGGEELARRLRQRRRLPLLPASPTPTAR